MGTGAILGIGLLGAGRIGSIHAASVSESGRAHLVAIADPDAAAAGRVAEAAGARIAEIDAILDDRRVDAVVIATPTDTHADLVVRAAAAGKAIFCEKPVDLDVERVRSCLAAAAKAGVTVFVGFNRRFDPSFRRLRERLKDGEIGVLELLTITSRDPAPPPIDYIKRSGGLFRDMMIHDFDMARWLLGEEPTELYATASTLVDPAIAEAGDVDTAVVALRTASGVLCQISNSRRAAYGYDQRIEAHGSLGMLRADNGRETTVEHASSEGYRVDPALHFFLERYRDAYRLELDAFFDAVIRGTAGSPSGEDGLKALVLADAATESARSGRAVSLIS